MGAPRGLRAGSLGKYREARALVDKGTSITDACRRVRLSRDVYRKAEAKAPKLKLVVKRRMPKPTLQAIEIDEPTLAVGDQLLVLMGKSHVVLKAIRDLR